MMEQYFNWNPPEQRRKRAKPKQRHKEDLRPD
jgi:hypothetical protein